MAARDDVVVPELLARREAKLLADQVDAGDLLAHAVLDLQTRVDLEEGDRAVDADEELAGARALVARLPQDRLGRRDQLGILRVAEERRRGLLDELLVAALQRAVAGRDDDDVAVRVGQALGLDVTRPVEEPLDEALTAAESRNRLAGRGLEQLRDLLERACDLEPAATATERGLDRDRQTVLSCEGDDLVGRRHRIGRPGNERCPSALGDVPGGDLVAERVDRVGGGADPGQAGRDDATGEVGVLGEKAVARVQGVGAGAACDVENLRCIEVGLGRAGPTEGEGLVGVADERGVTVGVRVDGDRREAGVLDGANHAQGDLAAVGDEHPGDGAGHGARRGRLRHSRHALSFAIGSP